METVSLTRSSLGFSVWSDRGASGDSEISSVGFAGFSIITFKFVKKWHAVPQGAILWFCFCDLCFCASVTHMIYSSIPVTAAARSGGGAAAARAAAAAAAAGVTVAYGSAKDGGAGEGVMGAAKDAGAGGGVVGRLGLPGALGAGSDEAEGV